MSSTMISQHSIELACDQFFVRVACRQRTSISGKDITGSMNRRINANSNSVQNARVEERQQKISRASETSDCRRQARLNRGWKVKMVARDARPPRPAVEKGPPSFARPACRTAGCVEMLPISKDAVDGPGIAQNLVVVYAWTNELDLAFETLAPLAKTPAGVYYGNLKLDPYWEPLRKDPRFDKLLAKLAPRD
jgi:hypothetical protein